MGVEAGRDGVKGRGGVPGGGGGGLGSEGMGERGRPQEEGSTDKGRRRV